MDRYTSKEKVIGVLKVEDIVPSSRHPEKFFTDQDELLVTMMANVIATPHGLGQVVEARRRCAAMSQDNMLALIAGEMPELTVNRNVKWRFAGMPFA